jgi:putative chitobiose transport system substrate-binding protein
MNRWVSGLAGLALLGAMVWWGQHVGQSSVSSPASKTNDVSCASRPVQLQFWTLQLSTFSPYFNQLISAYQTAHPDQCVHWVDVPFSEGEKRALTAVLSDSVPDVINLNPAFSATLQEKGTLLDLNDWIPAAEKASHYLPVTLPATTSWDGHWFGVPWYLTSQVVFYNKALLAQAEANQPPTTPAELLRLARTLRLQQAGYVMMPPLAEGGYFFKELAAQGIAAYDPMTGQAVFADDAKAVERLAFWVRAYQEGLIPRDSVTETHRAALERYQAGRLALLPAGASLVAQLATNAPQVFAHTGVAPQHHTDEGFVDLSTMVLVVPANSQHPKEAVTFARYVTNPANQLALSQLAPVLPSAPQAMAEVLRQTQARPGLLAKAQQLSVQQVLSAQSTVTQRAHQPQRNRAMDEAVQAALLGKLSPQDALHQAQIRINQL